MPSLTPMESTCPMNNPTLRLLLFILAQALSFSVELSGEAPKVEQVQGSVLRIEAGTGAPVPLAPGFRFTRPTLVRLEGISSLVFSCPGGIAGKVSGPAQFVLGPPFRNRYELDLRQGTVAILLDPDRPGGSPEFAVRTDDGYALAEGTFYAVTEYKGQAYGKVKRGSIKAKPKPPKERNFAAYGRPAKPGQDKVAKAGR